MKSSPRRWPRTPAAAERSPNWATESTRTLPPRMARGTSSPLCWSENLPRGWFAQTDGVVWSVVRTVIRSESSREVAPVSVHSGVEGFDGVAHADGFVVVGHGVGVLGVEVDELVALGEEVTSPGETAAEVFFWVGVFDLLDVEAEFEHEAGDDFLVRKAGGAHAPALLERFVRGFGAGPFRDQEVDGRAVAGFRVQLADEPRMRRSEIAVESRGRVVGEFLGPKHRPTAAP